MYILPGPTLSLADFSFTLPLILKAGPPAGDTLPYAPGPGLSLVSFSLYLPLKVKLGDSPPMEDLKT